MGAKFDYRRAAACEFELEPLPPAPRLTLIDRATYQVAKLLCAALAGLVAGGFAVGIQAAFSAVPQPMLSAVASAYAGRPVVIQCAANEHAWLADAGSRLGAADGYAMPWSDYAVLSPSSCENLAPIVNGGRVRSYAASGGAILVFAHEATHLALQSSDEGVVECTAVRNVWRLLPMLGALGARRNRLEAAAEESHAALPSNYRTIC